MRRNKVKSVARLGFSIAFLLLDLCLNYQVSQKSMNLVFAFASSLLGIKALLLLIKFSAFFLLVRFCLRAAFVTKKVLSKSACVMCILLTILYFASTFFNVFIYGIAFPVYALCLSFIYAAMLYYFSEWGESIINPFGGDVIVVWSPRDQRFIRYRAK